MTLVDALLSAREALGRNPLRALLTALGLMIGTAAVIAMIAVGAGAREQVMRQIRSLGANLIVIAPGSSIAGGVRLGTGSRQNLTIEDAVAIAGELPAVQLAIPLVQGITQVVAGNANWPTTVVGADARFLEAREWRIEGGRTLTDDDGQNVAKVIVLGSSVAIKLFGADDPVGRTVRVQNVPLQVVGVLAAKGQDMQGNDQDDLVVVPLSTAKIRILGANQASSHAVGLILTKIRAGGNLAGAERDIRDLLRQRHQRTAGQDDDVSIRNYAELVARQDESAQTLTILLGSIAAVSLLVGGIGIMNVMLVSVTERTPEIGLRLAVGARPRDVLSQFLIEAAALSGVGGIAGIPLGAAIAATLAHVAGWPIVIQFEPMIFAAACSIVIGIFFGFYPARRAARLQPAVALRYE
jgi:putative ABC transport system permease protein